MKIPLLDLKAQYQSIRSEIDRAVAEVFEEQQFVLGPTVERFERDMERYTGSRHAIGVASGSDALLLALMALDATADDCVVTTPFTFFATASAPVRLGVPVVFADIDPATFNLSADTISQAMLRATPPKRRWIFVPVHIFGRMAPMAEIGDLARRTGAVVVEDAAQAIGARQRIDGTVRMAGTLGRIGALSFFPSKNLGGAGDGGMVLTDDESVAGRLRAMRVHGSGRQRYLHETVGINSRLDALQAAVLAVKLRHLDAWAEGRRDRAARYSEAFRREGVAPGRIEPPGAAGAEHVFHQYVIRAERRDALREVLERGGVATQIYYPVSLHLQPCFASLGYRAGDLPESERATRDCLALPLYPELRDEQIDHVAATIGAFYRRGV